MDWITTDSSGEFGVVHFAIGLATFFLAVSLFASTARALNISVSGLILAAATVAAVSVSGPKIFAEQCLSNMNGKGLFGFTINTEVCQTAFGAWGISCCSLALLMGVISWPALLREWWR